MMVLPGQRREVSGFEIFRLIFGLSLWRRKEREREEEEETEEEKNGGKEKEDTTTPRKGGFPEPLFR